ncbi:MAG: penicillin-binding protein activator LpoB [Spirochaetes bacterium]|nr:penicillin-binding protein activator LpoB [Spirochaetota bacterium]MBU0954062.1 penicillin-binding protein activator LpoB [Spirochaetota bacterium]
MKKTALVVLVFLLTAAAVGAEELEAALYRSIDALSRAYLTEYPEQGMKAGLVILEISENSVLAERNRLGSTIEAYLRDMVNRSLVYELVDRANLDTLLKEIEFSLSGMVDPAAVVEIGTLAGVRAFLWGDISELRDRFLVNLSVTDAETGRVLGTAGFEIEQRALVKIAEELQYSYVAPNGIGLTAHAFIPAYMFYDMYNNNVLGMADLGLAYRFSRNFMLSGALLIAPTFTGEHYRWDEDVPVLDVQPLLAATVDPWGQGGGYDVFSQWTAQFRATFLRLDAQYTLNFSPKFNLGLSGGIMNAIGNVRMFVDIGGDNSGPYYRQQLASEDPVVYYQQPFIDTASVEYLFEDQFLPAFKAELRPEFFITPRIALSARVGFLWMKPLKVREIYAFHASWWFYQEGKDAATWTPDPDFDPGSFYESASRDEGEQRASWIYYGWNPLLRPDGQYWQYDLTSVYAQLGFSFFF